MARTKVRFKLDSKGVGSLISGGEMQGDIMRRAHAVAAAAGEGHQVTNATTDRARAIIHTDTQEAAKAEAESHTLTSAINAGRQ